MRLGCCGSMISPTADPIGIEIVEDLAAMGFDYIELSLADMAALSEGQFRAMAQRVRQSGIRCEACNNFFPPRVRLTGADAKLTVALDYATAAMDRAAELRAKIIVFGSSGAKNVPAGFDHGDAWKQIVELLKNLGPLAAARGITLAIEPLNRKESNIVNLAAEGLELVQQVDHPNVQLLIDYYHLIMEQEDLAIIGGAGAGIRHVHFAQVEGRIFPTQSSDHFAEFFDRLHQAGYSDRCSIEAHTRDFYSDAPRALRVLKELINGAGDVSQR